MRQVTAAVIVENGRLLIARRPAGDPLAGFWELPGGKVEAGESLQACLERELVEELSMASEAGRVLASNVYHYGHGSFEMIALKTKRLSDYRPQVHDDVAWITREELPQYRLAPADVELVVALGATGTW